MTGEIAGERQPEPQGDCWSDATGAMTVTLVGGPDPPIGAPLHLETARGLAPGTTIAARYRILTELGRGGMGVVYRAADRELDQDVALKVVDGALARDPRASAIVRQEVRLARRVTHPNVCRVHDLGEVDGLPFVTMEYVDGEDLRSLLHRIGRLTNAKALDIARQLCAGLHAAHERGVLHRDLKPANVMLDGAGKVRITDFGLAAAAETLREGEPPSGTPAYMAPELFEGAKPTKRSDLFALGALLYELWTGRPPFQATSLAELHRQHGRPVLAPGEVVPDLDPAVEPIVLACLQRDPARRPRSVLAVLAALAALPGGDPLALALASGETPSPELIASAGDGGALRRGAAALYAATLAVLLITVLAIAPVASLLGRTPMPYPAEVLADRVRTTLATIGWPEPRAPYQALVTALDPGLADSAVLGAVWHRLPTGDDAAPLRFFYRESPVPLRPANVKGRVTATDPPLLTPGSLVVEVDGRGRLRSLRGVPTAADLDRASVPDVAALLAAAGLAQATLRPVPPALLPPSCATTRQAWRGTVAGRPATIEAAWAGARPVLLQVGPEGAAPTPATDAQAEPTAPATDAQVERAAPTSAVDASADWRLAARVALVLVAAAAAAHTLRRRGGDVQGALRLGVAVLIGVTAFTVLGAPLADGVDVAVVGSKGLSHGVAVATEFAVYYLALEPWVRRSWPESMISWSRLLRGGCGDPLVGRHTMVGILIGVAMVLLTDLRVVVPRLLGWPEPAPALLHPAAADCLHGSAAALGALLEITVDFSRRAMMFFFGLVLARMLTRSRVAAAAISIALWATLWNGEPLQSGFPWLSLGWLVSAAIVTPVALTALRLGLLPLVVGFVAFGVLASFPLALGNPIHADATSLALAAVLIAAAWATRTAVRAA